MYGGPCAIKTYPMKARLLTLFVLLSITIGAKAQYVTIPDAAFVQWLNLNGYSTCMNGNQMDTTCSYIISATNMDVSSTSISDLEGIQYFDSLQKLISYSGSINHVTSFPPMLQLIILSYNRLVSIPALPVNLDTLRCDGNQLVSIPNLPNGLVSLDCGYNGQFFSTLPSIPLSLRDLSISGNSLSIYPLLPDSLERLLMGGNNITAIPSLPSQLKILDISGNALTSLAPLPQGLKRLLVNGTFNGTLPLLPASLTALFCSNNQLDTLPALPPNLEVLDCSSNNLTSLPALPSSCYSVFCSNNNITALPLLPDIMELLYCYNNPNLACMPFLGAINTLDFSNTAINCLPNYPRFNVTSQPYINTFPLCTPSNSNGCAVYTTLNGLLFIDTVPNCTYNNNETRQANTKVNLLQDGVLKQQTITAINGMYGFDAGYGNYEIRIDTTNTPFTVTCPGGMSRFDTLSATDSVTGDLNFALRCKNGFDLAAHSISSPMRFIPGRLTYVNIQAGDLANFFNGNCAYGVSGVVTAIID